MKNVNDKHQNIATRSAPFGLGSVASICSTWNSSC